MNIFRKLWRKIKGKKPLNCYEISDIVINNIHKNGGEVGENVKILNSIVDFGNCFLIKIGNDVTITGAEILTHDASLQNKTGYIKIGKVEIGNNVFISKNCVILPGNKIGSNVIIGASVVVAKDIPDNVVVVGNPWKVLCTYDEFIKKHEEIMKTVPVFESGEELHSPEGIELIKKFGIGYTR